MMQEEKQELIEMFGVHFEQLYNISPLASRILGTLIIDGCKSGLTFEELVDKMQASKSSISTNINLLLKRTLLVTSAIAIFTQAYAQEASVTSQQGIADSNSPFANVQVLASAEKLEKAREILENYGNYEWLTSSGSFVILNNGIEFAVTYLVMLLALIVLGSGRYISLDYWVSYYLSKNYQKK